MGDPAVVKFPSLSRQKSDDYYEEDFENSRQKTISGSLTPPGPVTRGKTSKSISPPPRDKTLTKTLTKMEKKQEALARMETLKKQETLAKQEKLKKQETLKKSKTMRKSSESASMSKPSSPQADEGPTEEEIKVWQEEAAARKRKKQTEKLKYLQYDEEEKEARLAAHARIIQHKRDAAQYHRMRPARTQRTHDELLAQQHRDFKSKTKKDFADLAYHGTWKELAFALHTDDNVLNPQFFAFKQADYKDRGTIERSKTRLIVDHLCSVSDLPPLTDREFDAYWVEACGKKKGQVSVDDYEKFVRVVIKGKTEAEKILWDLKSKKKKQQEEADHLRLMKINENMTNESLLSSITQQALVDKLLVEQDILRQTNQLKHSGIMSRQPLENSDWDFVTGIYYINRVTGDRTFEKPPPNSRRTKLGGQTYNTSPRTDEFGSQLLGAPPGISPKSVRRY